MAKPAAFVRYRLGLLNAAFMAALLSACGGVGDAGIGEGDQQPDPVVVDYPIAYIKRPLAWTEPEEGEFAYDLREPAAFNPGAVLYLRDRASPDAKEINISDRAFADSENSGPYDVKDLSVSYDGKKLLFAMRAPADEDADEDEQPSWDIWEYDIEEDDLRLVTKGNLDAEESDDIAPHYLPDGRIVFATTMAKQTGETLLDELKPQYSPLDEDRNVPAFNLHVMNADGTNIYQISFNPSHDLDPNVLSNGKIIFTRWNNVGGFDSMNLFTANPDGTSLELLYGTRSHDTGVDEDTIQFMKPQELPWGGTLVMIKPYADAQRGGNAIHIDTDNFINNDEPVYRSLGLMYNAQETVNTQNVIRTTEDPSPGGRYQSVSPLQDNTKRLLVSWSPCRLLDAEDRIFPCTPALLAVEDAEEAPPLFGLWIFDAATQTQRPIFLAQEGYVYAEAVVLQPTDLPNVILDNIPSDEATSLVEKNLGILHIASIYNRDGEDNANPNIGVVSDPAQTTADERQVRFVRFVKPVLLPDEDVVELDGAAFGATGVMREILGYAPVEPDGSIKATLPANVPFTMELLDANGRRLSARHTPWLEIKPGETMQCNGCHAANSDLPHGRTDAEPPAAYSGSLTGTRFPNTDASLMPQAGETMAEVLARSLGVQALKPNLQFDDVWPDPNDAGITKIASFNYRYQDLTTSAPTTAGCLDNWESHCRITLNYIDHLQPLWEANRQILDVDGVTVLEDRTCNTCHAPADAMGAAQVPAGQLDLTDSASNDEPDQLTSYRELLFNDVEQEVVNGVLIERQVQATDGAGNPVFETDENGELILDDDGNPVPVLVTIPVTRPIAAGNARGSNTFFQQFATGGDHEAWLSQAELKLISEWVDIGAQYYNNPFDVPQD